MPPSAVPTATLTPDAVFAPSETDATPPAATTTERPRHRYEWLATLPFILCHVAVLGALWSGVTWQAIVVCIALYWIRIFGVTAGYHRYFSHRTFETSRPMQFVLAWIAQSTSQKGAIWWASHHRAHHLYSDSERDLHSPRQHGFLHAHLGWLFSGSDKTEWNRVKDLAKFPELVWLEKYYLVPPIVTGFLVWLFFGWSGLFIGFFLSTVFTWHGTFFINSLAHVWGTRRFETKDDSRNNAFLALVTMGEGWHNNHHHYMSSARQGFYWWEIDLTYYVLVAMEKVGLVWNLKQPPERVLEAGRRADAERRALARG
ncbi:acyl-CoA desaturase [Sandaracinus amylolyticus]|uniref:Fatty acid desaturase n=1 Tax=Sandaracinus amylolyticus TaxID=927083 RepID=A0A0F6YGA5_9BACT|nr:acyl-CoA desaturase [Sandaracinus amylolyticus]AKF03701.1 Fatty acid desaturase [Sandaracinus amylolyticus]